MKILLLSFVLIAGFSFGHAEETMGEKAKATANDAGRSMKKGAHRTEEAMCAEGDMKCAGKKAGHRMEEGKDYTKDKAQEAKDSVDHK